MEEFDIENIENLNELEAYAYAQIHHEASDGNFAAPMAYVEPEPSIQRTVTKNSVINRRAGAKRYWAGAPLPLSNVKQEAESSAGGCLKAVQMPQLLPSKIAVQMSVAAKTNVAQSQNTTPASCSSAAVEKIYPPSSSDLPSGSKSKSLTTANAQKHSLTSKAVLPKVVKNPFKKQQRQCHEDMNASSLPSPQTQSQNTTSASCSSSAAIGKMDPPSNSDLPSGSKSKSQNTANAQKHSLTSKPVPPKVGEQKEQSQCHEDMNASSLPSPQTQSQNTTSASCSSVAVGKMDPPSSSDLPSGSKSKSQNTANAEKHSLTSKAVPPKVGEKKQQRQCHEDMNASSLPSPQTQSQNTTPASCSSVAVGKMDPPSSSDLPSGSKSKSLNTANAQKQSLTSKAVPPKVVQNPFKKQQCVNASSLPSRQAQSSAPPFNRRVEKPKKPVKRLQDNRQQKKDMPLKRIMPTDTIDLLSDESDDDDIVMVPTPMPPLVTINDSDEDADDGGNKCKLIKNPAAKCLKGKAKPGDNAIDKNTKQPASDSFAKPQTKCAQKAENSSRCTSPCSVLSSDDFIGQTDHRRMLQSAVMADDLNLQAVKADASSVVKTASVLKPTVTASKDKSVAVAANVVTSLEQNTNEVANNLESAPVIEVIEILSSPTDMPKKKKQKYRVEQTSCRALDVYESESEVTDSVYSKGDPKGATKSAVKRTIDSSSDENIENPAHLMRAKKTKKRSRKSNGSIDGTANRLWRSSSDSDTEPTGSPAVTDTEVLTDEDTVPSLPYIARGLALDKSNPLCPSRKGSLSVRPRRSSVGGTSAGHMSDHDFIATLNTLAKCHSSDSSADSDVIECSDELRAATFKTKVLNQLVATSGGSVTAAGVVAALSPSPIIIDDDEPYTSQQAAIIEAEKKRIAALPLENNLEMIFKILDRKAVKEPEDDYDADNFNYEIVDPVVHIEDEDPMRRFKFISSAEVRVEDVWNEEMRRFYNNSWQGEHFSINALAREMDCNKSLWHIRSEDRRSNFRNYSVKCTNCREYGHFRQRCPQRYKKPICFMCSQSGHIESRCPNSLCLRCGAPTNVFTRSCNSCTFLNRISCPVCHMRGHTLNDCPDKWRRYHSTTTQNETLNSVIEYKPRFHCCICGAHGHLPENCRYPTRLTDYPQTTAFIQSHQPVYDIFVKTKRGIVCNLLYDPNILMDFRLPENITSSSFYERFLRAVGLPSGKEMQRQRKLPFRPTEIETDGKKFVLNPCSQAGRRSRGAQSKRSLTAAASTVQVEEITESSNQPTAASKVVPVVDVNDDGDDDNEVSASDVSLIDVVNESTSTANDRQQDEAITINTDQQNNSVEKNNTIDDSGSFKAPTPVPAQQHLTKEKDTETLLNEGNSDSNYSFSEHFDDMPLQSESHTPQIANNVLAEQADIATCSTDALPNKSPRQMESLPDFISINSPTANEDGSDADVDDNEQSVMRSDGLSVKHVTDEADTNGPCKAKIYLTRFHSDFLLSPIGHEFLLTTSKLFELKVSLDWTSVGHVLVIHGLPDNQDRFHEALRSKYNDLANEQRNKSAEKYNIPKRTDVIIRFLRDSIYQLFADMGHPKEIVNRLTNLEKLQSKTALKQADKMRRQLNMILLGQAGLCNGDMHLKKLLEILKNLLGDCKQEPKSTVVSRELRDEIEEHWRLIFTSHRHEDYIEMIECYDQMEQKNHVHELNIAPQLLGQKVLNTSLTDEQKEQMGDKPVVKSPPSTLSSKPSTSSTIMALPAKSCLKPTTQSNSPSPITTLMALAQKYKSRDSPYPKDILEQRRYASLTSTDLGAPHATQTFRGKILQYGSTPPLSSSWVERQKPRDRRFNNNQFLIPGSLTPPVLVSGNRFKMSNENYRYNSNNTSCGTSSQYLSGRSGFGESVGPFNFDRAEPENQSTMNWSRESMKYIDQCMEIISEQHRMYNVLRRLQMKAFCGDIKHHEYSAIIKIYNEIMNNQMQGERYGDLD